MTEDAMEQDLNADEYDAWMRPRVEFMYNYCDIGTERQVIRDRFLAQMHKKTTLKDIGEKLDEFIWSSKAAVD